MAEKKRSFEESMARLEEIVTQLEKGEAPLEESLKLFEEGTKLTAYCSKMLKNAEQKIVKLTSLENPQQGTDENALTANAASEQLAE